MTIPFWSRPWLDGAQEHYREDYDESDLPRICLECGDEYFDDDEFCCPLCRAVEALNEDGLIDQVMEDQLSPPLEE